MLCFTCLLYIISLKINYTYYVSEIRTMSKRVIQNDHQRKIERAELLILLKRINRIRISREYRLFDDPTEPCTCAFGYNYDNILCAQLVSIPTDCQQLYISNLHSKLTNILFNLYNLIHLSLFYELLSSFPFLSHSNCPSCFYSLI